MEELKVGDQVICIDASDRYGWKPYVKEQGRYLITHIYGSQVVLAGFIEQKRTLDITRFQKA